MSPKANAVLCDSIHMEDNGKFILVGVISGALQTEMSSLEARLALFLNIHDISAGIHNFELEVISPDRSRSSSNFEITVSEEISGTAIQVHDIPFESTVSGLFKLNWRLGKEKKWSPLIHIPLEILTAEQNIKTETG